MKYQYLLVKRSQKHAWMHIYVTIPSFLTNLGNSHLKQKVICEVKKKQLGHCHLISSFILSQSWTFLWYVATSRKKPIRTESRTFQKHYQILEVYWIQFQASKQSQVKRIQVLIGWKLIPFVWEETSVLAEDHRMILIVPKPDLNNIADCIHMHTLLTLPSFLVF